MNWLSSFPDENELLSTFPETEILHVNAHVHTPFSFSAFTGISQIFEMAKREDIAAIGINDFFVTDGYETFLNGALYHRVFPLFNIEFIGLMKNEQQHNIRINDPSNPGRCYFCGKGLDYPFHVDDEIADKLKRVITMSQEQVKQMIVKLNHVFSDLDPQIRFDYARIQSTYAKNLVRERHLAKAVRKAIFKRFPEDADRITFFTSLFGHTPKSSLTDHPALENEIRSVLLKSGGSAFVEEDDDTFMNLDEIITIVLHAGGIPCYPVLLDDSNGHFTEFEQSPELLFKELSSRNIGCIEFIPGRNDAAVLDHYVRYFHQKGFIILLGTEHNTPEMIPLMPETRGHFPLSGLLKSVSWEGTCIVAAHQYLKARGDKGFIDENGFPDTKRRDYFKRLGNSVILNHKQLKN